MSYFKFYILIIFKIIYISWMVIVSQFPDHNADAFKADLIKFNRQDYFISNFFFKIFNGAAKWDSLYFIFIAKFGYVYEHILAFPPGFPLLIRLFSKYLIMSCMPYLNENVSFIISGLLINFAAYSISGILLYHLTYSLYRNKYRASLSLIMFCINPANVFFSVNYSESLYFMLTLAGHVLVSQKKILYALFCYSFSSIVRINGLINFGYFAFFCLSEMYNLSGRYVFENILIFVLRVTIGFAIFLLPLGVYHIQVYNNFCLSSLNAKITENDLINFASENQYLIRQTFKPAWCYNFFGWFYSSIQFKYWNVGFLNYFTIKQIPNFLLALPIIIISIRGILKYFRHSYKSLWILDNQLEFVNSLKMLPFILHLLFLVVFGFFTVHVQILTRMICSSTPLIYWFVVDELWNGMDKSIKQTTWNMLNLILRPWKIKSTHSKLIVIYFLSYSLMGYVLHCNFLPWT